MTTNSPNLIDQMEKNFELEFLKQQLRLVVRSNRSRTNAWRKEELREREKRNYRYYENKFRLPKYKWDQATVLELPTIPEDKREARLNKDCNDKRLSKSQPTPRQEKLPKIFFTSSTSPSPTKSRGSDRCKLKEWELEEDNKDISPEELVISPSLTSADMSLSLFKEFVCAYNPETQCKRRQVTFI